MSVAEVLTLQAHAGGSTVIASLHRPALARISGVGLVRRARLRAMPVAHEAVARRRAKQACKAWIATGIHVIRLVVGARGAVPTAHDAVALDGAVAAGVGRAHARPTATWTLGAIGGLIRGAIVAAPTIEIAGALRGSKGAQQPLWGARVTFSRLIAGASWSAARSARRGGRGGRGAPSARRGHAGGALAAHPRAGADAGRATSVPLPPSPPDDEAVAAVESETTSSPQPASQEIVERTHASKAQRRMKPPKTEPPPRTRRDGRAWPAPSESITKSSCPQKSLNPARDRFQRRSCARRAGRRRSRAGEPQPRGEEAWQA